MKPDAGDLVERALLQTETVGRVLNDSSKDNVGFLSQAPIHVEDDLQDPILNASGAGQTKKMKKKKKGQLIDPDA